MKIAASTKRSWSDPSAIVGSGGSPATDKSPLSIGIVGSRPEQPDIFSELYRELRPTYHSRQRGLPGRRGLAQVKQGYHTDLVEGVRLEAALDPTSIGRRSPRQDLAIMAKTLPVTVLRKGAH